MFQKILINYIPRPSEINAGRYRSTKDKLDEHVNKVLNRFIQSDSALEGEEMKISIPSKIFDFYTRLEILLG